MSIADHPFSLLDSKDSRVTRWSAHAEGAVISLESSQALAGAA
jgi:hypothetical protein